MEGYRNVYGVWKDEGVKKEIVNVVNLFLEKILDGKRYDVNVLFEDEWSNKYEIVW